MLALHHCIKGLEHPWIFGTRGPLETQWILRGKHMQIKHTDCPAITQRDDLPSLVAFKKQKQNQTKKTHL